MSNPEGLGGRPRKHLLDLPVYDSYAQMSGQTGIPETALKLATKQGCLFKQHGRCHLRIFLEWFFGKEMSDEDGIDWLKRDKRAVALIREIDLQKKRDVVIDFENARSFTEKLTKVLFFGELDRLANEFPSGLKGKGEVAIHEEVKRQIEQIKLNLDVALDNWKRSKGK